MRQEAVLEIGTSKISVYVGRSSKTDGFNVLSYAEVDYAGYSDGKFIEPENLNKCIALAIHNAESYLKKRIKKLVVGVPAEFLVTVVDEIGMESKRPMNFGRRHIVEMIKKAKDRQYSSNHEIIGVTDVSYMIDDQMVWVPEDIVGTNFSLVLSFLLAECEFIDYLSKMLYDIGIVDIQFKSSTLTSAMLIPEYARQDGAIFIDCGHLSTTVCSVLNNGLMDLKTFACGGGYITSDLMECLNISYSDAENLKKKVILTLTPSEDDYYECVSGNELMRYPSKLVGDIVTSRVENIASIIHSCIDNFTLEKKPSTKIYLSGGGLGFFKGITDVLEEELQADVELIMPEQLQFRRPDLTSSISLLGSVIE